MREIKFRGKSELTHRWWYGNLVTINKRPHIIEDCEIGLDGHHIRQTSDRPTSVIPETIGQFIGKYDKNGRKIYEGDIVTMEDFGFTRERPFIVVYDNFDAGFKFRGVYCLVTPNSKCEVIGNIEDNPNLIPID